MRSWRVEDIDFSRIDRERAASEEDAVVLVCAASFVESGSKLYTANLSAFFQGDAEVEGWLNESWEHDELQHGRALRAYISHVWPDFDWERAFGGFMSEYAPTCKVEHLEKTRGLELAARCVVEMGTAGYYRAMSDYSQEPVFRHLMDLIRSDEVRHYKHFYQYFQKYNEIEGHRRWRVLVTLLRRLAELKNEDNDIALRHVYAHRYPDTASNPVCFKQFRARAARLVERNLSADMCIKMLLKPLSLSARWQHTVQALLKESLQRFYFHS